jgi:hypothetical protein
MTKSSSNWRSSHGGEWHSPWWPGSLIAGRDWNCKRTCFHAVPPHANYFVRAHYFRRTYPNWFTEMISVYSTRIALKSTKRSHSLSYGQRGKSLISDFDEMRFCEPPVTLQMELCCLIIYHNTIACQPVLPLYQHLLWAKWSSINETWLLYWATRKL